MVVPFIGRAAESAEAARVLSLASGRGHPAAVIIDGDAGIGKSRLLAEIARGTAITRTDSTVDGLLGPAVVVERLTPDRASRGKTLVLKACAGPRGLIARTLAVTAAIALATTGCSVPAAAEVIELEIPEMRTAEFRMSGQKIERLEVVAGREYIFRITNGYYDHNFFIGKAEDLAARRYEQLLAGTPLWSDGVREVRYTFTPGDAIQFACTLPGHYGSMHVDLDIR